MSDSEKNPTPSLKSPTLNKLFVFVAFVFLFIMGLTLGRLSSSEKTPPLKAKGQESVTTPTPLFGSLNQGSQNEIASNIEVQKVETVNEEFSVSPNGYFLLYADYWLPEGGRAVLVIDRTEGRTLNSRKTSP